MRSEWTSSPIAATWEHSAAVARLHDLRDGPKRLYESLQRLSKSGRDCCPSFGWLSAQLGKSVPQIKRDVRSLEKYRLMTHEWRKGRRTNTYIFLDHPVFERSRMRSQVRDVDGSPVSRQREPFDSPHLSLQEDCESSNKTFQPNADEPSRELIHAELTAHRRAAEIKEIQKRSSEASSSATALIPLLRGTILDEDAIRRIWTSCQKFAPSVTPEEVAAAFFDKGRQLGPSAGPGLFIVAVPKMFEGPAGFHVSFRAARKAQGEAAREAEAKRRRILERTLEDAAVPLQDREFAQELLDALSEMGQQSTDSLAPGPF